MTPSHLHLVLNHMPVIGFLLATLLLLVAWLRRSRELQTVALLGVLLVALSAIPAYMTGEPAEEQIEHAPGIEKETIEAHEESATVSLTIGLLAGVAALVTLVRGRGGRGLSRAGVTVTLVLALTAAIALGVTANRGGHIRHPEITPGAITNEEHERGD